jgi:hypothetical protein
VNRLSFVVLHCSRDSIGFFQANEALRCPPCSSVWIGRCACSVSMPVANYVMIAVFCCRRKSVRCVQDLVHETPNCIVMVSTVSLVMPLTIAVVTGGASGIGLSISKLFARQGGLVHIFDINAAETASVAASVRVLLLRSERTQIWLVTFAFFNDQINEELGRLACFSHTVDITDAIAVKGAFDAIVAQHGGVHVLVNNAGVVAVGTLEKVTPCGRCVPHRLYWYCLYGRPGGGFCFWARVVHGSGFGSCVQSEREGCVQLLPACCAGNEGWWHQGLHRQLGFHRFACEAGIPFVQW